VLRSGVEIWIWVIPSSPPVLGAAAVRQCWGLQRWKQLPPQGVPKQQDPLQQQDPPQQACLRPRAHPRAVTVVCRPQSRSTISEAACVSIANPSNGAQAGEDVQGLNYSDAQSKSVDREWERENILDQTIESQFRSFEDSSGVCDKKEPERTGAGKGGKKGGARGGECT